MIERRFSGLKSIPLVGKFALRAMHSQMRKLGVFMGLRRRNDITGDDDDACHATMLFATQNIPKVDPQADLQFSHPPKLESV